MSGCKESRMQKRSNCRSCFFERALDAVDELWLVVEFLDALLHLQVGIATLVVGVHDIEVLPAPEPPQKQRGATRDAVSITRQTQRAGDRVEAEEKEEAVR